MSGVEIDAHDHAAWDAVVRQLQPAPPDGNLFVVFLGAGGKHAGTVRIAIPDPASPELTAKIGAGLLNAIRSRDWPSTHGVIAAYSPPHTAGPVAEMSGVCLAAAGIEVFDSVLIHGGRCWSYLCPDPDDHPGGAGQPVDPLCDTAIQLATALDLAQDQK